MIVEDRPDRRHAGTRGNQHYRSVPSFAPEAGAVGSDELDGGADGDTTVVELPGELAVGIFLDDEVELRGFARRICHGERARNRLLFFGRDGDVDILARPELDRLV